jgi:hypothetical protein
MLNAQRVSAAAVVTIDTFDLLHRPVIKVIRLNLYTNLDIFN